MSSSLKVFFDEKFAVVTMLEASTPYVLMLEDNDFVIVDFEIECV